MVGSFWHVMISTRYLYPQWSSISFRKISQVQYCTFLTGDHTSMVDFPFVIRNMHVWNTGWHRLMWLDATANGSIKFPRFYLIWFFYKISLCSSHFFVSFRFASDNAPAKQKVTANRLEANTYMTLTCGVWQRIQLRVRIIRLSFDGLNWLVFSSPLFSYCIFILSNGSIS